MKNGPYELVIAPKDYPGKRYRGRYCYEHHLVWWQHHGIVPASGYQIHHKNGNHRDNKLSNLELLTKKEHHLKHGEMQKVEPIVFACGYCGKNSKRRPNDYRFHLKNNKCKKVFCSRRCGTKYQFRVTVRGEAGLTVNQE